MGYARFKSSEDIDSIYPLFSMIIGQLWTLKGEAQMKELAKASNVAVATLYNWKSGATINPRLDTLSKVAHSLGYEITWKRTRRAPLRSV